MRDLASPGRSRTIPPHWGPSLPAACGVPLPARRSAPGEAEPSPPQSGSLSAGRLRRPVPTRGRRSLGRRLVTAPLGDDAGRKFRVTHRFHPLYGREYVLLERGRYWGAERVMWEDERGEVRSLPASWTSAGEEDAFRVMSAGRSAFRVEDLLELVEVVRGVGERSGGAGGVAGGVRGGLAVKGISSHE